MQVSGTSDYLRNDLNSSMGLVGRSALHLAPHLAPHLAQDPTQHLLGIHRQDQQEPAEGELLYFVFPSLDLLNSNIY